MLNVGVLSEARVGKLVSMDVVVVVVVVAAVRVQGPRHLYMGRHQLFKYMKDRLANTYVKWCA
jgi:hypothetical protein